MPGPVVVQLDAEKAALDWFRAVQPAIPALAGYTFGTRVEPGVTPIHFVAVRKIGGVHADRVAERPQIDVRVWADPQSGLNEGDAQRVAQIALANMRRDLGAQVIAAPVTLPDPADPTRTVCLFTVELLIRGTQE